jgi:hypothetical protein
VNKPEVVYIRDENCFWVDDYDYSQVNSNDVVACFKTKEQRDHYYPNGTESYEDHDVEVSQLATPLSVAIGIGNQEIIDLITSRGGIVSSGNNASKPILWNELCCQDFYKKQFPALFTD